MLILFVFANARENNDNDSVDHKNIDQKPEKASIFISREASIYGKEIIYNANYKIIKKKKFKTNAKLSVNKNKPGKTKHNIPTVKINSLKKTILYNYTDFLTSVNQKAQCIRVIEQHEPELPAIYNTDISIHFFRMLMLSIYHPIRIEHSKNMILSIRPPPKKWFHYIRIITTEEHKITPRLI